MYIYRTVRDEVEFDFCKDLVVDELTLNAKEKGLAGRIKWNEINIKCTQIRGKRVELFTEGQKRFDGGTRVTIDKNKKKGGKEEEQWRRRVVQYYWDMCKGAVSLAANVQYVVVSICAAVAEAIMRATISLIACVWQGFPPAFILLFFSFFFFMSRWSHEGKGQLVLYIQRRFQLITFSSLRRHRPI